MSSIPYICLYRSYLYELTGYTDQEVGRLVRALLRYLLDGTTPELTEREHLIWYRLQNQLDRDAEHYDEVCQARSRSAKKRWDKKPILQLYPKAAKENENENEKEKEKENEKEKDSLSLIGDERETLSFPDASSVKAYCQEAGLTAVDAQHFVDYYSATGWKCGDKPMQDWKAMVRLWERRAKAENIPTPPEESYGCTIQR